MQLNIGNVHTRLYIKILSLCILNSYTGYDVHICDFHREQAWLRWTSKSSNGVNDVQEEVLAHLRRVARSACVQDYESNVARLKSSSIWLTNQLLRNWLTNTWLKEHKVLNVCWTIISWP